MDMARKIEIFRARFYGRQEIYGRMRKVPDPKTGGEKTVYSPVCNNIWTEGCHIKRGTGVPCSSCENQLWEPVSDTCVRQHIAYQYMHNFYLVLDEGSIRFGAVDFDVKQGKEEKGYDFFEVQKFCRVLKAQGIAYGIARSTSDGYHVYMFFKENYPAVRFRAVISKLFEAVGFDKYVKERIKPAYPEIFPKQDYVSQGLFGNGITPPMMEPLMMKGRKCWVDDNDVMIGAEIQDGEAMMDAQWEYLDNLGWADPQVFERIIEEHKVHVEDVATLKKRAAEGLTRRENAAGDGSARPHGHIEKVLYGCESFRDLVQKVTERDHTPSHVEGMALWHLAINTVDGKDWFLQTVKSWGRTQGELKQLEYSIQHNYRPHSCNWMKEQGICVRDGLCAEAAPRTKTAEGNATDGALEDLNEQEQKLYNPYRFAFSQGAELLHALIKEADKLLEIEDPEQKETVLRDLARRAQALDKRQARSFKEHVDRLQKSLKIPKNRVAPIFKAAEKAHYDQQLTILEEDSSVYEVGSYVYRKRFGGGKYGYYQITKGKDELTEKLLIEMDILITEERYYTEDGGVQRTVYRGVAKNAEFEKKFEIDLEHWMSDMHFQNFFGKLMGTAFSPIKKELEFIKQAAIGWSEKRKMITKMSSLLTQGFYEGAYLMPSVTVDANGLRPTKTGVIDISHKDVVKNLDWQILEDDVFVETLRHIKDDFLEAWPEEWTYIGLPHVFRPLMMKIMGWTNFPTLFYDGLTGIGKSEITKMLQQFWGHFPALVNLTVTQKYLEEMAYEFNDACLVLDDFKGLSLQQKNAVTHQIQYGYDGGSTGKLNRDSTARKARKNRSTLIMSGEGFIQNQASVVARTLLVEVHRFDAEKTAEAYLRVLRMSKNYSGVTPRFLHWLMGREKAALQQDYEDIRLTLYRFAKGRQNASRIAENVASNHLTWKLFTSFMEDCAVINAAERDILNKKHWDLVQMLYHRMVFRCEEEQEAVNFKSILLSLILSGKVRVEGLKGGYDNARAPVVGYVPDPADLKVGYYYPDAVMNEVNEALRQQGVQLPKRTVARQLADLKIIKDADPQRHTKLVRKGNSRVRVWVLDHVALELVGDTDGQDAEASAAPVVPIRAGVPAMRDNFGLF